MFKKILIPLDGSEIAERALMVAKTLVQDVDSELLLLSVTIPHQIVAEQSGVSVLYLEQAMDKSRQELSEYLQTVQRTVADLHCTVHVVVKEGDPASAIVDTAAEEGMDLIVMSTHGRSGFTRWMMGSVTTKVLHEAACPVLSVRSAEPISRILITLDGSELAEQALEPGFRNWRKRRAALENGCSKASTKETRHIYKKLLTIMERSRA
jgi:nucleotide-binding universal stress UspA family protein